MKIDGGSQAARIRGGGRSCKSYDVSLYGLIPGSAFRTVLLTLEGSFKLRCASLLADYETRNSTSAAKK